MSFPQVLQLPIDIELTPGRCAVAEIIGRCRYRNDRKAGIKDQRVGETADLWKADVDAYGAELAFCEATRTLPDFSIMPRSGGYDTLLPSGLSVDVKMTPHENGRLIMPLVKTKANTDVADICVLVVGTFPNYSIVGWHWTKALMHRSRISTLPGRTEPTFVMQRKELITVLPLFTKPDEDVSSAVHHDPDFKGVAAALDGDIEDEPDVGSEDLHELDGLLDGFTI